MFVHQDNIIKGQKLKLLFSNSTDVVECTYTLHESIIASNWFRKIKHLKDVSVDPVESYMTDLSDIKSLYRQFCDYAQIPKDINWNVLDQDVLNQLHRVYESHHPTLVNLPNNQAMYKFHKSIHYHEIGGNPQKIVVGWGNKEGPVTYNFLCNKFYEDSVKKNNLYLSWIELGKRPSDYYLDGEPNSQERINELCKPHVTFGANFFITHEDRTGNLPQDFIDWFDPYKKAWCKKYGLDDWTAKDEYSAPLLAIAEHDNNLEGYQFEKIIL